MRTSVSEITRKGKAVLGIPVGSTVEYTATTIPTGYLPCDGSAVSRSAYQDLFSVIGTTHGSGDGATTFNLPDHRGRVCVGYAASGGHTDVSTVGNNDGVAATYRRPKHRHNPHTHTFYYSAVTGTGPNGDIFEAVATQITTSDDGGSGNTNDSLDAPAYLVVNRLIKV